MVFVCGAFMMVILPGVAAYIGGSVGFSGCGVYFGITGAAGRMFRGRPS
jgi:hypothetical protein